jgi:hypothetical protein
LQISTKGVKIGARVGNIPVRVVSNISGLLPLRSTGGRVRRPPNRLELLRGSASRAERGLAWLIWRAR